MREQYDTHYGKYDSSMTAFLAERVIMEGFADESFSFGDGESYERVGRRIVFFDDQGFVYSWKCETVSEAIDEMAQIADEYALLSDPDDAYADDGGQAIGQYDE